MAAPYLRTTRFVGEFGTLIVEESPDPTEVRLEMQDKHRDPCSICLSLDEWKALIALPYLHRDDQHPGDVPPDGVYESVEFIDEHSVLHIIELSGDQIRLKMIPDTANCDEEALIVDLTIEQWDHLCGLDYVRAQQNSEQVPPGPRLVLPTDPSVH